MFFTGAPFSPPNAKPGLNSQLVIVLLSKRVKLLQVPGQFCELCSQ